MTFPGITRNTLAVAVVLAIHAGAGWAQSIGTAKLDGRVAVGGTRFVGEDSARVLWAGKLVRHEGGTAVCGIYVVEGRVARRILNQFMRDLAFVAGSQIVRSNLGYFRQVPTADDVTSQTDATCQLADVPWQDAFAKAEWKIVSRGDGSYTY